MVTVVASDVNELKARLHDLAGQVYDRAEALYRVGSDQTLDDWLQLMAQVADVTGKIVKGWKYDKGS